jgi:hypothetical protein
MRLQLDTPLVDETGNILNANVHCFCFDFHDRLFYCFSERKKCHIRSSSSSIAVTGQYLLVIYSYCYYWGHFLVCFGSFWNKFICFSFSKYIQNTETNRNKPKQNFHWFRKWTETNAKQILFRLFSVLNPNFFLFVLWTP